MSDSNDNSLEKSKNTLIDKNLLLDLFTFGVEEVKPQKLLPKYFKIEGSKEVLIGNKIYRNFKSLIPICIGKASVEMGKCFNKIIYRNKSKINFVVKKGFIVVNEENFKNIENFHCFISGHPLPNKEGINAVSFLKNFLKTLGKEDLIILMLSGGGSAMLPSPPKTISLNDKILVNKLLLSVGANIKEINTVRKHLSSLKGGNFLRYSYPATTSSLIISDVVGDDLSSISSGLTVPDNTSFEDAIEICKRYDFWNNLPKNVKEHLINGSKNFELETPKENNEIFKTCANKIVASNSISLNTIKKNLDSLKNELECKFWEKNVEGNVKDVALRLVKFALNQSYKKPLILLSGGETTVKIYGEGKGGRNQEFALYVCLYMNKLMPKKKFLFLSAGTDGRDGPTDSAGGIVDHNATSLCKKNNLDLKKELNNNNSYYVLEKINSHIKIKGTNTNVADIQIFALL